MLLAAIVLVRNVESVGDVTSYSSSSAILLNAEGLFSSLVATFRKGLVPGNELFDMLSVEIVLFDEARGSELGS